MNWSNWACTHPVYEAWIFEKRQNRQLQTDINSILNKLYTVPQVFYVENKAVLLAWLVFCGSWDFSVIFLLKIVAHWISNDSYWQLIPSAIFFSFCSWQWEMFGQTTWYLFFFSVLSGLIFSNFYYIKYFLGDSSVS